MNIESRVSRVKLWAGGNLETRDFRVLKLLAITLRQLEKLNRAGFELASSGLPDHCSTNCTIASIGNSMLVLSNLSAREILATT